MTGKIEVMSKGGREWITWAVILGVMIFAARTEAQNYHPPLEAYVDTSDFPQDLLIPADGSSPGQRLRVKDFNYSEITITEPAAEPRDIGAMIVSDMLVDSSFIFNIPGLESAFSIEIRAAEFHVEVSALGEKLEDLPDGTTGAEGVVDKPFRAEITATSFPISLLLNPEFFQPMIANADGTYVHSDADTDLDGEIDPAKLTITLGLGTTLVVQHTWDGETEIYFDDGSGPASFPTLGPLDTAVMLGETGVVLDIGEILFDFSDEESPAGVAEGPTWNGILIKSAKVAFVDNGLQSAGTDKPLTTDEPGLTLALENFQIGTGGFSGTITGDSLGLSVGLFGMDMTLDTVGLQFTRNTLSGSSMAATIENFPFFEGESLQLALSLDMQGNFTIGLAAPDDGSALATLGVENVLNFHVQSAFFERRADPELFLVGLNGQAELLFMEGDDSGGGGEHPMVDVNGLTITSEGDVSLEGGWITLSQKASTDFNGFAVSLSQIGFGRTDPNPDSTTDTPQSWVGFTGGVSLVAGLGAEAEMKRMQFLWPKQGSGGLPFVDVKLDGIKVAFHQPNVVRFEGLVEWFESESSDGIVAEGFAGKMQLDLLALNMTFKSRIVIGSAKDPEEFKFFFVDAEVQLPTGIPLGQSGVSIYGFQGMLAYSMSPNISAFDSPVQWVNGFTKSDNVVVQQSGDPGPTWQIERDAVGFGAGIILGTTPDNGFTANGKIALTIAVPGPVVMLTGQANVLKARTALSSGETPLFVAVALFDGRENTFVLNLGVFYDLANVVKVSGEAEAFFDLDNPANWHLYLGQKDPESRRITADVLSLLQGSAYYMIDPYGLGFGAKAGFGNRWKFGPLKVTLEAWMSYDASLSWRPIHAWAEMKLHGAVELSAFGVGIGLSVDARLAMQAPKPYAIEGEFKVKLNLPWPLPDPSAKVHLKWEKHPDAEPQPLEEVVNAITLHTRKDQWTFAPNLESHTVSGSLTISWPDPSVNKSELASPEESLPEPGGAAVPLDPDLAGDFAPLVPLDTFVSIRFEKSMNDAGAEDLGLGNPFVSSNSSTWHSEEIDGKDFRYDAVDYELLHAFKESATTYDLSSPIAGDLYGNWPVIPLTASTPADNTLDILSKNNFRYYTNTTFLGYDEDGDAWTEWVAGHYGYLYCLESMDEKTRSAQWDNYHYYVPNPDPSPGGTTSYPRGFVPATVRVESVDCDLEIDYLDDEDFVLPPYSVFRFTMEGNVHDGAFDYYRKYGNSVLFHTEGPPLSLNDYVRMTVPELSDRPYYRNYHVGLQFNENYMNKLYREEGQFFQLQILDENENPLSGLIVTDWTEADSHTQSESEQAWIDLLIALGVASASSLPMDDVVHAGPETSGAVRPGERHIVRAWLEDERLTTDSRLDSDEWLQRHDVIYHDQGLGEVVLYEFGYLASRYNTFEDLFLPYIDGDSGWFTLSALGDIDTIINAGNVLNRSFPDDSVTLLNGDTDAIGVFLRHLLSPRAPDEFTSRTMMDYIARTPGYSDETSDLEESDLSVIAAIWGEALTVFDSIDEELKLDRSKEPLPEEVEVNVLEQVADGVRIGLLIELPEAIDLSRVSFDYTAPSGASTDIIVVPNAENTRMFVFVLGGASVTPLGAGVHELVLTFHLDLSDNNPRYYTNSPLISEESVTLEIDIPDGEFEPEVSP